MTQDLVTPAEEAVISGMLGGLMVCVVLVYLALRAIGTWTTLEAAVISIGSFVIAGYIAPRIIACWLGKSLDDVLKS